MAANENTDEVLALESERTIRDLIGQGVDIAQIFTRDKIDSCQKVLDDARGSFFDIAGVDLAKLEAFVQNPSAVKNEAAFEDIAALAGNIRGHAELFGFALIASISGHIAGYCEPGRHTPEARLRLINDLTKMLHLAIKEKIADSQGAIGRQLKESLGRY